MRAYVRINGVVQVDEFQRKFVNNIMGLIMDSSAKRNIRVEPKCHDLRNTSIYIARGNPADLVIPPSLTPLYAIPRQGASIEHDSSTHLAEQDIQAGLVMKEG